MGKKLYSKCGINLMLFIHALIPQLIEFPLSDISLPLTNQHSITLFSRFAVKKWNWSEQTNQLTITLYSLVHMVKNEIVC